MPPAALHFLKGVGDIESLNSSKLHVATAKVPLINSI